MNISEFASSLLFIFFPGIICAYMIDMFTNHSERTQFQFVLNSFLLGFGSYLIYTIFIYLCAPTEMEKISFLHYLSGGKVEISLKEIIIVCFVSICLGIVIIVTATHKWHFRVFQYLRITNKFGEQDVWGFLMNSPQAGWVTVRDIENNVMYDGWIKAFSDNSREAELLLESVNVYKNSTGEYLYNVSVQYLSLSRGKISVEVRSPIRR